MQWSILRSNFLGLYCGVADGVDVDLRDAFERYAKLNLDHVTDLAPSVDVALLLVYPTPSYVFDSSPLNLTLD